MTIAARDRDRHAALAVLLAAYQRYGTRSFPVDPLGQNWGPLHNAEAYGWCWFQDRRCAILDAGLRELEPFRRTEPRPCVEWVCPVCLTLCGQPEGETGLPENTPCPTCHRPSGAWSEAETRERADKMLEEPEPEQRSA